MITALVLSAAFAAPLHSADTTCYCLRGTMADGTYTRRRSAASNTLPLGTKIRLVGRPSGPGGILRYVIRDRIGHGTQLDLWTPSCSKAINWGRNHLRFKIGWKKPIK